MTTLEQVYRNYSQGGDAARLLKQTHWYSCLAEFDPRTGDALTQPLSQVFRKLSQAAPPQPIRDRLWRITEHCRLSLIKLFRGLNESPRREQAMLPLRAVRELDSSSFMALSRRSGRTIREKLAGKPYLQAVRRLQSVDLPENQLLKAFSLRLEELLELRVQLLGEEPDALLWLIRSWLRTDEAKSIRRWENLPPNNTLLSHRDYRAVYDAWGWLQHLDEAVNEDMVHLRQRQQVIQQWTDYWKQNERCIFAEQPIIFDYEHFTMVPWLKGDLLSKENLAIGRKFSVSLFIGEPICIDLLDEHPIYAYTSPDGNTSKVQMPFSFLWQEWHSPDEGADECIHMDLLHADAAYVGPEVVTVAMRDLFFPDDGSEEHLNDAAHALAQRLREVVGNETLLWLCPDQLSDFEVETVRRNLNARFRDAEPLPRSIAAVFESIDYASLHEGYAIAVMDYVCGCQSVTKIEVRHDEKLKQQLPETCGFYFERHPTILLSEKAQKPADEDRRFQWLRSVDEKGTWYPIATPKACNWASEGQLNADSRIGRCDRVIRLKDSPVCGGLRLRRLSQLAGDCTLWRDQIPELSIKAKDRGWYRRICLVSQGTTVRPIRNQPVQIPVNMGFTLPPDKKFYQLPLYIGDDTSGKELGFSAKLESPSFPLKRPLECRLNMTFTYGADDPYQLVFEPIDHSINPIVAKWRKTEEEVITDAKGPEYPLPLSWTDLMAFPRKDREETTDLLNWVISQINILLNETMNPIRIDKDRVIGQLNCSWKTQKNNVLNHFSFATVQCGDNAGKQVYINEDAFLDGCNYNNFKKGDYISFIIKTKKKEEIVRMSGVKVSFADYQGETKTYQSMEKNICSKIHVALYFPVIQIWRDGRSLSSVGVPEEFKKTMRRSIIELGTYVNNKELTDVVREEILCLLSFFHKDTSMKCISWLTALAQQKHIKNIREIGFALGDLSEAWQKTILRYLLENGSQDAICSLAYAIWREQGFVHKLLLKDCERILNTLIEIFEEVECCHSQNKVEQRSWSKRIVEPVELLLGLLRLRSSEDERLRMLLQPGQAITNKLLRLEERVEKVVEESHIKLFSRLQLNLPKRDQKDKTPDILYALRLYLSGDDGANAIQITGVQEEENE